MTDIVERLREGTRGTDITKTDVVLNSIMRDAADEIERLRARLETVRHEAQAATKLVLEHQSKNCHLHADIKRLREALMDIAGVSFVVAEDAPRMRSIAKKALGDN